MEKINQGISDFFLAIFAAIDVMDFAETLPPFKILAILGIPATIAGLIKFFIWLKNQRRF